jgi:hypothetical protein
LTFLALTVWAQSRPVVRVDARPENLRRNTDRYFDRYHPPKEMGENEAAYTQGTVRCQTEASAEAKVESGRKNAPCVARITIQGVSVLVRGEISVYLPNPPSPNADPEYHNWKVLEAHEEGHAQIYRELFAQFARPTAEEVFAKSPPGFNVSIPSCNDRQIRARMDAELDVFLDALTAEAVSKITAFFKRANEEYDAATDHGRQGADGGRPTVENQLVFAQEIIRKFRHLATR